MAPLAINQRDLVAGANVAAPAISKSGGRAGVYVVAWERDGDGWKVNGKKIFATMAPASTILNAAVTYRDEKNVEYYGYAQVPTDAAGAWYRPIRYARSGFCEDYLVGKPYFWGSCDLWQRPFRCEEVPQARRRSASPQSQGL